ncbi:hypothetical protein KJ596_00195, partial [Patescibacteria group bacterium]|nr:hypothetical protein [Patescibacteria group bacterium]
MKLGRGFADEIIKQKDLFHRADREKLQGARNWQDGLLDFAFYDKTLFGVSARVLLLRIAIFLVLLIYIGRLFWLQVIEGRRLLVLAEENRVFVRYMSPKRGAIISSDGEVLAGNKPGYRVSLLFPAVLPDKMEEEISYLSVLLGMSEAEVSSVFDQAASTPFSTVTVKNNISHTQQISLASRLSDLPGIIIEGSLIREYSGGEKNSSFLGFTGKLSLEEFRDMQYYRYRADDLVGKDGLEKQYEEVLRGESDEKLLEVDALGNEVRVLKETEGEKGKDLVVSVRSDWQREVHHFLQEGIEQYSATGGGVILQEVQTGRILSIVSLPSYDNQLFAGGISERDFQALLGSTEQPLFNRSIAGVYPPGSVVKPAVAAAALKEGIINETTKLSDFPQIIKIGGWEFPDWTIAWNRGAHGIIDVKEALAYSCDTFFYKIGGGFDGSCDGFANGCYSRGLGVEKIASVFRLVGFGQATGIDLPGEGEGLVPDQEWKMRVRGEPWFLGNTYHLSIGQGDLLATPVQIVNYVSAIANGGRLMRPVLGLQIKGARGEVQSLISPEVIKEAII